MMCRDQLGMSRRDQLNSFRDNWAKKYFHRSGQYKLYLGILKDEEKSIFINVKVSCIRNLTFAIPSRT